MCILIPFQAEVESDGSRFPLCVRFCKATLQTSPRYTQEVLLNTRLATGRTAELFTRRFLNAVAAALLVSPGPIASALADAKDYELELVDPTIKIGARALITVRLVNKSTGSAVPGAIIAATRLDMTPEGMPTMQTKLEFVAGGPAPGTYQFRADIRMAGRWQLSLRAQVPGETGMIERKLILKLEN